MRTSSSSDVGYIEPCSKVRGRASTELQPVGGPWMRGLRHKSRHKRPTPHKPALVPDIPS